MKEILHIYTRVSSSIQEEEGTSLETQLEEGKKRAKQLGMKFEVWNEGSESGSKNDLVNRPQLLLLLKKIEDDEVKHLYVWNTDRLSRNLETWGMIRLKLIENDITLHTPTGKQQLSDIQTNLMIGIMAEFSQYDNLLRTERFRLGKLNKIKKGGWKGGPPPYGYELNKIGDLTRLVINDKEGEVVNKIFELYLKKVSKRDIGRHLQNKNVVTRRDRTMWSDATIHNILFNNTHYQGYWNYTDKKSNTTIRVDCPPIVPADVILKVKELGEIRSYSKQNTKRVNHSKHEHLLKEFFVCDNCGGDFSASVNRPTQHPYYFCTTKQKNYKRNVKVECSSKRNLRIETTDELVWNTILNIMTKSNLFKELIKKEQLDNNSIVVTKTEVRKIKRRLLAVEDLIENISNSIVNNEADKLIGVRQKKEVDNVLKRLDKELLIQRSNRENIIKELSSTENKGKWVDWVVEWGNRIEELKNPDLSIKDKKKFIAAVVDKIIVENTKGREHELTIKFNLPYVNDKLVWNDENKKSKGYFLKNGSRSKLLRVSQLKKSQII
jgi:DNA invertase Pin-like site-specific DNA recombinase|tara:strand:+ start:154 stop:1806 length:1653 start_codon:yes stop_codon:yes gene_type:complete